MYLIGFDESTMSDASALAALRQESMIDKVQFNNLVEYRDTDPDDANWFNQWNMEMVKGPAAWDLTTGGLTEQGDTIVVAVLEPPRM